MKTFIIFFFSVFSVLTCHAQVQKRRVTPEDYAKWGKLTNELISNDGKWVSFKMQYTSGNDTLFIADTKGNYQKAFPKANSVTFSPDSKRAGIKSGTRLIIIDLERKSEQVYDGIHGFNLLPSGETVMLVKNVKGTELKLVSTSGQLLWSVPEAKEIAVS